MNYYILAFIVLLPMILFLWTLRKVPYARTTKQFFLADKTINNNEFIDTSVAYAYQIAALTLFASWGYEFGFWTIWVPVFWGLGYFLLRYLNNKNLLTKYITDKSSITIHGFLSKSYKTKQIARFAALASMLGLSGTAFFEAEFTSNMIISATSQNADQSLFLMLFFVFVLVALIYIIVGGYKSVVMTDKLQLSIGFIFYAIFISMSYYKVIINGYTYTGIILFTLSLLSLIILNMMFRKFNRINSRVFPKKYSLTLLIVLIVFIIAIIPIIYSLVNTSVVKDSFTYFFRKQQFGNLFSLGYLPLIGLLLANGLWQIVDISGWQRLASLENTDGLKDELNDTFKFVGIYSPITWTLAIFFGMSLRYIGFNLPDAWSALQQLSFDSFHSALFVDNLYILILIFSMISIMYSTLDSLISSLSYTTYYDIILEGNLEEKDRLSKARLWTILYTFIFFVIYIIVRMYVSGIDNILYTFYAFQLALFPSIVWSFSKRNVNKASAYASLIGGSILCIIPLTINSDIINPYSSAAIFSVIGATFIYLIFTLFKKYEVTNE